MVILLVWGHFGLLATSCLETVSPEVTWHRGVPMSLANSSLQNGSFHTVRCVFPADSSYPSEAKRMPGLEVMEATLMKLILSATGCFLGFPQKICFPFFLLAFELFLYLLPVGSFVSSCRSLVRRCYSLARTCGHYSLSVCQPKPQTLQVTVSHTTFVSQAMVI